MNFIKHGIEVWSVNEGEQRMDNHVDKAYELHTILAS